MIPYNKYMKCPENYLAEMKELFREDYDAYLRSFDDAPSSGLRINTAKISTEDFLSLAPFHLTPVPWTSNGFYYAKEDDPARHPFYHAGLYYIQEPSAMCPASILPVRENDVVLDACAAPGGKSFELASKLHGTGLLVSNDISFSRQNATLRHLERAGAANILVTGNDLRDFLGAYDGFFDKILLDVPCSGEGMFRKDPSLIKAYETKGSSYYAPLQKELLEASWQLLKDGGYLVYSTCTFSVKENEEVLASLLDQHPEAVICPLENRPALFAEGIGDRFRNCARLYPHKLRGEGHFAALLQKRTASGSFPHTRLPQEVPLPRSFGDFLSHVRGIPEGYRYEIRKEKIHLVPDIRLPEKKLRVLRSGLYLGELRKDRFEPSQAFAMALRKDQFDQTVSFAADDPRLAKYLKGETVFVNGCPDGLVLVCAEEYPVGFAKGNAGSLKNKLDPAWRKL